MTEKIELSPELRKELVEKANKFVGDGKGIGFLTLAYKVIFQEFHMTDESIEKVIRSARGNKKVAMRFAFDELIQERSDAK